MSQMCPGKYRPLGPTRSSGDHDGGHAQRQRATTTRSPQPTARGSSKTHHKNEEMSDREMDHQGEVTSLFRMHHPAVRPRSSGTRAHHHRPSNTSAMGPCPMRRRPPTGSKRWPGTWAAESGGWHVEWQERPDGRCYER